MNEDDGWTIFKREPFFLRATEREGKKFKVVRAIKLSSTGKGWDTDYDNSIGTLTLGKDIEELPKGLQLYLEHEESIGEINLVGVIQTCRKYAHYGNMKYVSAVDPYHEIKSSTGKLFACAITPRLFREIKGGYNLS